jgi:asparagine synthase (glutamine-hydrolysing)
MNAISGVVAAKGRRLSLDVVRTHFKGPAVSRGSAEFLALEDMAAFAGVGLQSRHALFADSSILAVCDCRLENVGGLRTTLDLSPSSNTAEIIAQAYRHWGERCAAHLEGEFSFAIWDKQRYTLYCARDRFGVRPLYYRVLEDGILFGTTAACAAADTGLAALEIDESWVVDHLNGIVSSNDRSAYRSINRLPPAHWLRWSQDGLCVAPYWSPAEIEPVDDTIDVDELREALRHAVVKRLPSEAPAAFLSGGLDSSSICCLAESELRSGGRPPLNTISMIFDGPPKEDERIFVEAVLRKGRFNPTFIRASGRHLLRELPRLVRNQEGPFLAPAMPVSELCYETMVERGYPVVLDGHGGDEVISTGITRLFDLARSGRWTTLAAQTASFSLRQKINPARPYLGLASGYGRGLWGRGAGRLNRLIQTPPTPEFLILAKHWREDIEAEFRRKAFGDVHPSQFPDDRHAHLGVLTAPLQPYAFEVLSKLCASHGVECRYPFWDRRVVELCVRMMSAKKLKNGWPRALLRNAMRGVLPDKIRRRVSKLDFSGHAIRGMQRDKPMLIGIVEDKSSAIDTFVDRAVFREAAKQLDNTDAAVRRLAYSALWRATTVSLWMDDRLTTCSRAGRPFFVREPA